MGLRKRDGAVGIMQVGLRKRDGASGIAQSGFVKWECASGIAQVGSCKWDCAERDGATGTLHEDLSVRGRTARREPRIKQHGQPSLVRARERDWGTTGGGYSMKLASREIATGPRVATAFIRTV